MRWIWLIVGISAALFGYGCFDSRDAVRERLPDGSLRYPGYEIKALAPFAMSARILSSRDYRSGREAELSPIDLAVGWDQMALPQNISAITVSQRNRWMYWRSERLPVPRRQLESSIANIHIIPASAEVADTVAALPVGAMVRLEGSLVEVTGIDGWRWRSSLSRTDTGARSCELLWLTRVIRSEA